MAGSFWLGLDLGSKCGWATVSDYGVSAGVWDLGEVSIGNRIKRLVDRLDLHTPRDVCVHVAYEEVMYHAGVRAAHVYGGLLGGLEMWCEERGIQLMPVGVTTIKKHATGNGRASKKQMVWAARAENPRIKWTHDSADAYWVLRWARDQASCV